ncbi:class I SAM-dependent methyltransferase [Candidatus Ichthyocystis sparus]|uniref:class I SAM-dependent methyltransferase n=1 Tax=Candidatus Ichthyocystis sparus TaxID=1561004 RepID=UPI000A46852F|nr:class I SAM-dependent methyltransferase [Candidatus Ichthyocystis sparus]
MGEKHYFGFREVTKEEKTEEVRRVFQSVSPKYDLMNDVMSLGIHRLWKRIAVCMGNVHPPKAKILDVASGSGDLALLWSQRSSNVIATDINRSMLDTAKARLTDNGKLIPLVQCDGEQLPFKDRYFDVVSCGFGVRNMSNKDLFFRESRRVLVRGGRIIILEFSTPKSLIKPIYDFYSWKIIPFLGEKIAHDRHSYQYLVESIRMHPSQEELTNMIHNAGFSNVCYHNLMGGIVAIHVGIK